jgi:phosphatidylinositol glycan class N
MTFVYSRELLHNIQVLDTRIQSIVDAIEKYWNRDGRTTYLFTADHGMTDWGSHGAGLDHETQTPGNINQCNAPKLWLGFQFSLVLAWGAGIRRPRKVKQKLSLANWPLVNEYDRSDVNQTDLSILVKKSLD